MKILSYVDAMLKIMLQYEIYQWRIVIDQCLVCCVHCENELHASTLSECGMLVCREFTPIVTNKESDVTK